MLTGLGLGWYYPTENLFFSMVLPVGHEAEFAGIFVWCGQILGWLGTMTYSILVHYGVPQKFGVIVVSTPFLFGAGALMFTGTWDEILEESGRTSDAQTVLLSSGRLSSGL